MTLSPKCNRPVFFYFLHLTLFTRLPSPPLTSKNFVYWLIGLFIEIKFLILFCFDLVLIDCQCCCCFGLNVKRNLKKKLCEFQPLDLTWMSENDFYSKWSLFCFTLAIHHPCCLLWINSCSSDLHSSHLFPFCYSSCSGTRQCSHPAPLCSCSKEFSIMHFALRY